MREGKVQEKEGQFSGLIEACDVHQSPSSCSDCIHHAALEGSNGNTRNFPHHPTYVTDWPQSKLPLHYRLQRFNWANSTDKCQRLDTSPAVVWCN